MRTIVLIALLIPSALWAGEFKLVRRIGEPNPDHEKAWNGHVARASWVDDEHIVYWTKSGRITCLDVRSGEIVWSLDGIQAIQSWSLSPKTKRLAYSERSGGLFGEDKGISVIDCETGKRLVHRFRGVGEVARSGSRNFRRACAFTVRRTIVGVQIRHVLWPQWPRLGSDL
jgi:hypothetical protein